MDLYILAKSDKPIYLQIYEQIVMQIIKDELQPDFCLPSIRTVAAELQISVITVKKAWALLEQDKYIYTLAGKGCFVSPHHSQNLAAQKLKIAKEKIESELTFYKNLGLSKQDLINLIDELY